MGVGERWCLLFATGFFISYIPVKFLGTRKWSGAGLSGTCVGLLSVPLLPRDPWVLGGVLIVSIAAACWLCGRAERILGNHDDPRIVLDEIVGMWTTAAFLPRTLAVLGLGFVLFRLLDSVKLPPYAWLDRLPGGLGVVGDDVGAAVVANVLLRVLLAHWPGLGL